MCLKEITAYENPEGGRPIFGWAGFKNGYREIKLPCGKCSECVHDYYSYWATRGYYELLNWKTNFFVTFTYDENHLPENHSLNKKEFQKFIKKVKKNYVSTKENPIRQIYCGEYGEQTSRPHYHCILFNIEISDLEESRRTDQGHICFNSKGLTRSGEKDESRYQKLLQQQLLTCLSIFLKKNPEERKRLHYKFNYLMEHQEMLTMNLSKQAAIQASVHISANPLQSKKASSRLMERRKSFQNTFWNT